ncbi:MAD-domain-containing protein [Amylostereum chailletii]|nr:MAD-domain-containing protein [Amylostereum chailletii]
MSDRFKTPINPRTGVASSLRSTATASKRDSLAAELERDPRTSAAKRQQRSQAFTSHMAHSSLERQLVAAQTAKVEIETKLREKDIQIDRLEGDRRWLAEREKEEREEKETERAEREEEKSKTDRELRELRAALSVLREEHADLKDAHSSLSRTTAQTIAAQRSQITSLSHQTALLQEQLHTSERLADERSHTIDDIQSRMDELSVAQADTSRSDIEVQSWAVLREELSRLADHNRKVEATNAKLTRELRMLRERQTSVEVLKEEKRTLEARVRGVEELREQVVRLEGEVQAARKEREEWARKATQLDTPSETPVSVTQSLSSLRLTYAKLLEDHGANVAQLRRREAELEEWRTRDLEARAAIEEAQNNERVLRDKIARLEQSTALAEREVGFLQAFNASYASEAAAQDHHVADEAKDQQIKNLETLLQEQKGRIRALENEVDELGRRPTAPNAGSSLQQLRDELHKERQAAHEAKTALEECEAVNEKQLEAIDNLEQTLFELRGEIGAGRHVPPGVRILTMKENPAQQWADLRQEVMDRLKGENEALIRRLKELEDNGAGQGLRTENAQPGKDLVPRESWEVVMKEKAELEETVKQKEKRLLRLQQVFTAKSAEFREAIASIMGVKLAFYPNGQVRITSQYDLNASFVFQPTSSKTEGARMQLIAQGEGGPQELPQLMRNWVEQEQCIPCFLSSVTLECYDKWKRDREMGIEQY